MINKKSLKPVSLILKLLFTVTLRMIIYKKACPFNVYASIENSIL